MEKLLIKFSVLLNVNFYGLNLSMFTETVHKGIKEWYPRKSRYFTVVGQSNGCK